MKKKVFAPVIIVLILICIVSGYIYCSYNPNIRVGIGGGHGIEIIHLAYSTYFNVPVAKEIEANIIEFGDWNDEVVSELMEETMEPRDIKVSGEVVDGKTTLRYEGYYTSKDGQTLQYFEEKTFDFVLVPDEELLK